MTAALRREVDKLVEEGIKAGIHPDDPLAGVLVRIIDLVRAMGDATDRLQAVGAASALTEAGITAAVERASAGIAFRLAARIDRRTAVLMGVTLFVAALLGGVVGFLACWLWRG